MKENNKKMKKETEQKKTMVNKKQNMEKKDRKIRIRGYKKMKKEM